MKEFNLDTLSNYSNTSLGSSSPRMPQAITDAGNFIQKTLRAQTLLLQFLNLLLSMCTFVWKHLLFLGCY